MAIEKRQFKPNPIDWATRDTLYVIPDGYALYYDGHPDYDDVIVLYGDGVTLTASLPVHADTWQGGTRLTEERIADKEGATFTTDATGWWTVGVSIGSINAAKGEFHLLDSSGRGMGCRFGARNGGVISRPSSYCEILEDFHNSTSNANIMGYRLIGLSTSDADGFALQAYLLTGTTWTPQLLGNLSRPGYTGLTLTTPVNNNTLPGGGTADSFLVAGSTKAIDQNSNIGYGRKINDNNMYFTVQWPSIPSPNATNVDIGTIGNLRLIGNGTINVIDNTYELAYISNTETEVLLALKKTGAFSALASGDVYLLSLSTANDTLTLS